MDKDKLTKIPEAEREYERNCRKIFIHQMYSESGESSLTRAYVQCASKRRYMTIQEANRAIGRYDDGQTAYYCPRCFGYHLTTSSSYSSRNQNRDWKESEEIRRSMGITGKDLENEIWRNIFEGETPCDATMMAAKFAEDIDCEMRECVSYRHKDGACETDAKTAA